MTEGRLFPIVVSSLVSAAMSLLVSVTYFQSQVDTVVSLLGAYAVRETQKAITTSIDAVGQHEGAAIDAVKATEREVLANVEASGRDALQAIEGTLSQAVATVADAHGIAANESASLKLHSYLTRRWCDRTGERELRQAYRNTTALPIEVVVTTGLTSTVGRGPHCSTVLAVDGSVLAEDRRRAGRGERVWDVRQDIVCTTTITVPPDASFHATAQGDLLSWHELASSECVHGQSHSPSASSANTRIVDREAE